MLLTLNKLESFLILYPNREDQYLTLKLSVRTKERASGGDLRAGEIRINEHLEQTPIPVLGVNPHSGREMVRRVLDSFEIAGQDGKHLYILY